MKTLRHLLFVLAIPLLTGWPTAQALICTDLTIPPSNPDSAYTINGDGTVSDTRNGLMWKRCAEGQSGPTCSGTASSLSWVAALKLAASSAFLGYSDWRLPNAKELASLTEVCRRNPAINEHIFPATPSSYFWSGSPLAGYSNYAWDVNFYYGYVNGYGRNGDGSVRLVRGGQLVDSFDSLVSQRITFGTAPTVVFGGTGTLSATASSGLAVTFTSSTPTICSVSANIVLSLSVAGTCIIAANQPGGNPSNFYGSYAPAPQVIQTFAITAITPPSPPGNISITSHIGSATLKFSAPGNTGGLPIAFYTAACSATGQTTRTQKGSASPITVRNLTAGVAYQCTLTATNQGEMTSAASTPLPVPPVKKSSLTPVLMLLLD